MHTKGKCYSCNVVGTIYDCDRVEQDLCLKCALHANQLGYLHAMLTAEDVVIHDFEMRANTRIEFTNRHGDNILIIAHTFCFHAGYVVCKVITNEHESMLIVPIEG